jgi:hypothetical protein
MFFSAFKLAGGASCHPNYKPRGARRLRRFSVASLKINRFIRLRLDIEAARRPRSGAGQGNFPK